MMCVSSLSVFAIFFAVISHSFGSPVAHEHGREAGFLLARSVEPEPDSHECWRCDLGCWEKERSAEGYSIS
ncbi:hypothetical protein AMELA_G00108160 [Ameiurus melas]|uniref:Secreted protein n=1 Tax=Ameiurus melas TaxID=219545 RepID=A0A7J6AR61_AMEME|nr:hypothetical protein AMELA_G00108160 [Ameiurus melas]